MQEITATRLAGRAGGRSLLSCGPYLSAFATSSSMTLIGTSAPDPGPSGLFAIHLCVFGPPHPAGPG